MTRAKSGRFDQQGWVITGGTRGLGLAIAQAAIAEGATVLVCGRTPFAPRHPNLHAVVADVSNEDDVEHLFDTAETVLPGLDVVVNNAARTHAALLVNTTLADWQDTLATNLRGPFLVCRRAVEELLTSGGGAIVNIASFAAHGLAGEAAYSASKSGLLSLTRSIAKEYGRAKIRCNAVVPGFIDSELAARTLSVQRRETLESLIPNRRLATLAEVVEAVLFLASSDASFIQGDTLHVTAGLDSPPVF